MPRYFNSTPVYVQSFEAIENGVLKGVIVCEEGEAKGHGVWLNKKFIQDVVAHGKQYGNVGVKARFGHPNMCSDALGTHIGQFKNFRMRKVDEEEWEEGKRYQAVADLHLSQSSKVSPNGDLHTYTMELAKEHPDQFGTSIVFKPGETTQKKIKHKDGSEGSRYEASIQSLLAADVVDSPAATRGMFNEGLFNEEDIAAQVTNFLDSNPRIYELALNHPDVVQQFINKYEHYKQIKMTKEAKEKGADTSALSELLNKFNEGVEKLLSAFGVKKEEKEKEKEEDKSSELKIEFTKQFDKLREDLTKEFGSKITDLENQNKQLSTDLEKAQKDYSELSKKHGEETKHDDGTSDPGLGRKRKLSKNEKAAEANARALKGGYVGEEDEEEEDIDPKQ